MHLSGLYIELEAWPTGGTQWVFTCLAFTAFSKDRTTALPIQGDHRHHCSPLTTQAPAFSKQAWGTEWNRRMFNKWKMLSVKMKALESCDPPLPYLKVEFLSVAWKPHVFMTWAQKQAFSKNLKEERIWNNIFPGWKRADGARVPLSPRPEITKYTCSGLAGNKGTSKALAENTFWFAK